MARRDFARNENGGIALISAVAMSALLGTTALAVDLGSVFLQTRRLQGTADLAALAAARDLDNAQAAALATARANGWDGPLSVTVEKGRYAADQAVQSRFQSGAADPDAVRVRIESQTPLHFGKALTGKDGVSIARQATAARADLASFSIGTRLAALDGGLANALLSGLTGSSVSLSVMDYDALADADVDLFDYMDALKTELNLTAATYDEVLDAKLTTGRALKALSRALADKGQTRASQAARTLASAAGDRTPAQMTRLFDPGPYGAQGRVLGGSGAKVQLDALNLSKAVLELSNGARQVQLDLGAAVPGVANLTAWLAIGEPPNNAPWMAITSSRDVIVRTAQTRLYLEAKVGGSGLLAPAQVKLPILVEAASGAARLKSMSCATDEAALEVAPGLGSLMIGEVDTAKLDDFKTPLTPAPATIAKAPLFTVTGKASASLGGQAWQTVRFRQDEVRGRVVKTVSTRDLAQATVSTLLGELALDATVPALGLNLGLGESALTGAVASLLTPLARPLDDVLNSLTGLVGVRLGQADVRMNGLRCRDAALVA
ncbi:pilus assembly protein TadG-related protein [Caulobacter sp.]|uniref:TadG family pilus assembly protein n=1 Tax=Caulobacter sp. TaxID=78 RepID=UPI0025BEDF83|nr:pilus assembly protein TadG-related protein [Caulobacter sp.]